MTDPATSSACLQAAMQALLRGDTMERDRLCRRAETLLSAEQQADAVQRVLAIDFYVRANGVVIPTLVMARSAGVLQ